MGQLPSKVPRKQRTLEKLADVHIAMWLAGDKITDKERKLLQTEKDRRKQLTPEKVICILTHNAGVTPEQLTELKRILARHPDAVEVRAARPLRLALRTKYTITPDIREALKDATIVIAASKDMQVMSGDTDSFWDTVRYAKHRKIPVTVVLRDGSTE